MRTEELMIVLNRMRDNVRLGKILYYHTVIQEEKRSMEEEYLKNTSLRKVEISPSWSSKFPVEDFPKCSSEMEFTSAFHHFP